MENPLFSQKSLSLCQTQREKNFVEAYTGKKMLGKSFFHFYLPILTKGKTLFTVCIGD